MDKNDFTTLFLTNVTRALEDAKKAVGLSLSQEFDIELHGGGISGKLYR
jgi:hypothetical protein